MRGTVCIVIHTTFQIGITPACAGNSFLVAEPYILYGDHPRVCGEQNSPSSEWKRSIGSPPRVRGTGIYTQGIGRAWRITPACAGNSLAHLAECQIPKDHPRVCGEQAISCNIKQHGLGSPPRVRGTVPDVPATRIHHGITPACAGNSPPNTRKPVDLRDHPRVCGEQDSRQKWRHALRGSPPRVRGTDEQNRSQNNFGRITPACAGNSPIPLLTKIVW